MKQELTEVHELFKQRIRELRPDINLDEVATGEHWYGSKALDLKLIDEIGTSDDFLLAALESADLYKISYRRHKRFLERVLQGA
jgi:serine protease SohB